MPGLWAGPPPRKGAIRVAERDVPGYTELKALGSGGSGDVVLARHDASGTLVAIKYIRRTLLTDPRWAQMFRGEAEVLAYLDDLNIVRLYEYVESASGAAIVMELVDGVSLRDILVHQGATTPEAALVVLQGSLLGLAAAHRRGVVHRDYKPENVLINGQGVSKLTDFGIAARTGDRPVAAGTVVYAPPEQFAGAPASPAGDVYAATVTFYECLVGRPPFGGDTYEALLYQHISQPVPLDPVPEPLRPLIAAGMAKEWVDRPSDAAADLRDRPGRGHDGQLRRGGREDHRGLGHADHRDQPARQGHGGHHGDHTVGDLRCYRRRPVQLLVLKQGARRRAPDLPAELITVAVTAGHDGEGDQREPRPGRSGCRRDPRSTSRSGPTAR
jgi:serine/threonine protein kinase